MWGINRVPLLELVSFKSVYGDGGSTFLGALLVGLIFHAGSLEIILKILIIVSPLFVML